MNSKERKRLERMKIAMRQQAAKHARELESQRKDTEMIERFVGQIRHLYGAGEMGTIYKYEVAIDPRHMMSLSASRRIDFAHMVARRMIDKLNEKFPCCEEWNAVRYNTGPIVIRKDTP